MTTVADSEDRRVTYPAMARPWNGFRPRRCNRRRFEPRDLHGGKRIRDRYHRLVSTDGPTGLALVVLLVLTDEGHGELRDVQITQERIVELVRRRADARVWGTGRASVYRALRTLERLGWLSVEDVPLPDRGALVMCRYRFHVPLRARAAWDLIVGNAQKAAAEASRRRVRSKDREYVQPLGARPGYGDGIDAQAGLGDHRAGIKAARDQLGHQRPRDG